MERRDCISLALLCASKMGSRDSCTGVDVVNGAYPKLVQAHVQARIRTQTLKKGGSN